MKWPFRRNEEDRPEREHVGRKKSGRKWQPGTLGQYHDLWGSLVLKAPDNFRDVLTGALVADQRAALREEFERLRSGFHFARAHVKDDRVSGIAAELIEMSLEGYLAGDIKTGAHALQEAEGLIWPSRKLRVKYGVEAERRAFGENVLYAGVSISPYPYEGTAADLGEDQAHLLALAQSWCRSYQEQMRDFRYFSWVVDLSGAIKRLSLHPTEDTHEVLKPVERSRGYKRLKMLGETGQIRACVLMEIVAPQGGGIVAFDLEQRDRPRISARQLFSRERGTLEYQPMRYHLEDPQFIT